MGALLDDDEVFADSATFNHLADLVRWQITQPILTWAEQAALDREEFLLRRLLGLVIMYEHALGSRQFSALQPLRVIEGSECLFIWRSSAHGRVDRVVPFSDTARAVARRVAEALRKLDEAPAVRHMAACLYDAVVPGWERLGLNPPPSVYCDDLVSEVIADPSRLVGPTVWPEGWRNLQSCPVFGRTLVTLLNDDRVIANPALYDKAGVLAGMRAEAALFSWAVDAARNREGPLPERLTALQLLVGYVRPSAPNYGPRQVVDYRGPVETCPEPYGWRPRTDVGFEPLPDSAVEVTRRLVAELLQPRHPDPVRSYAACLRDALAAPVESPRSPFHYLGVDPVNDFEYETLCGRRIRIRNNYPGWVSVRLVWGANHVEIEENQQARPFSLPSHEAGEPYADQVWQVPDPRARLFRIQQVITVGNGPPYILIADLEPLNVEACP